jgi:hypothetical protein
MLLLVRTNNWLIRCRYGDRSEFSPNRFALGLGGGARGATPGPGLPPLSAALCCWWVDCSDGALPTPHWMTTMQPKQRRVLSCSSCASSAVMLLTVWPGMHLWSSSPGAACGPASRGRQEGGVDSVLLVDFD